MVTAKLPDEVRSKLVELGFDTEDAFQSKDDATFEQFAKEFLITDLKWAGVTADNWSHKPLVQRLRGLWQRVGWWGCQYRPFLYQMRSFRHCALHHKLAKS